MTTETKQRNATHLGLLDEFFNDYSALSESIRVLSKTESNPFFNSKYVTLSTILEEAKKVCKAHNFIFIQIPKLMADGKAILETILIHRTGREITCSMPLVRKDDSDPQKLGAALTYMRRYSLTSILGIQEADDDGNGASKPSTPPHQKLTKSEVKEHEPIGTDQKDVYLQEMLDMANAMQNSEDEAIEYILDKASFPSTKPESKGKIITPKWEKFITNSKWISNTLDKVKKDYELWNKNEKYREQNFDAAQGEDGVPF